MKKTFLTIAAIVMMLAGTSSGFDNPSSGNRNGRKQAGSCDTSGSGARAGRRTGPQDGSGPIHTPGTGGGTGTGRRAGRR